MKEHLKTDSLRLGETDRFSTDYLRWPEIIYLMMLKNYSYSLYFIYILILNTSDIIILFCEQEQEQYFYMWYPEDNQAMCALPKLMYYAGHIFSVIFLWDILCWMILNQIPSPQERHSSPGLSL